MSMPEPRLPDLPLPNIRNVPNIPGVGAACGGAGSYLGEQLANLPDLQAILHLKTLKHLFQEAIATLIEGYLPKVLRAPKWAERVAAYEQKIIALASALTTIINGVSAELNAAKDFANDKINEVNQAKQDILDMPVEARTAAQTLMIQRYNEYTGEINSEISRLQDSINCLSS